MGQPADERADTPLLLRALLLTLLAVLERTQLHIHVHALYFYDNAEAGIIQINSTNDQLFE